MWRCFLTIAIVTTAGTQTEKPATRPAAQNHREPVDAIDRLVRELNSSHGLWINGMYPRIPSSDLRPEEIIAEAAKLVGFDQGNIKTWHTREIRPVKLEPVPPDVSNTSAALLDTDLGPKILLFWPAQGEAGWWARFYDVDPKNLPATRPASAGAANEALIPTSLNALLPKITSGTSREDVKRILSAAYPNVERQGGTWAGQTGYLGFRLDERYSVVFSAHLNAKQQAVVTGGETVSVTDRLQNLRLEITPYYWDKKSAAMKLQDVFAQTLSQAAADEKSRGKLVSATLRRRQRTWVADGGITVDLLVPKRPQWHEGQEVTEVEVQGWIEEIRSDERRVTLECDPDDIVVLAAE